MIYDLPVTIDNRRNEEACTVVEPSFFGRPACDDGNLSFKNMCALKFPDSSTGRTDTTRSDYHDSRMGRLIRMMKPGKDCHKHGFDCPRIALVLLRTVARTTVRPGRQSNGGS